MDYKESGLLFLKRRESCFVVECYKTVFGLNNLNFSYFFELTKYRCTRSNRSFNFFVKHAKCIPYKHSFDVRIARQWNNLPRHVVEAGNFKLFKD